MFYSHESKSTGQAFSKVRLSLTLVVLTSRKYGVATIWSVSEDEWRNREWMYKLTIRDTGLWQH
jgi:hypothetical protein